MKDITAFGLSVARQTAALLERGATPSKIYVDLRHLQNLAEANVPVAVGTMGESVYPDNRFMGLRIIDRPNQWTPIVE